MYVDFESIMTLNSCNTERKSDEGNYKCPFCGHGSFKVYPNARAYCHTKGCNWKGDAIQFHADFNKITNAEAFKLLNENIKKWNIKLKVLTYDEAMDDVAEKLQFMAMARMYFAFYKDSYFTQTDLQKASGLSKSHFSKAIRGKIDQVSVKNFNLVHAILSRALNFDQMKKEMFDQDYQKKLIKEEGFLEQIKKFMKG